MPFNNNRRQFPGTDGAMRWTTKKKALLLRPTKWWKSRLRNGILCIYVMLRRKKKRSKSEQAELNGPSVKWPSNGRTSGAGCCSSAVIKYRRWMFVWTFGIHCRAAEAVTLKGEKLGLPCLCNDLTVWINQFGNRFSNQKVAATADDSDTVGSFVSMRERLPPIWTNLDPFASICFRMKCRRLRRLKHWCKRDCLRLRKKWSHLFSRKNRSKGIISPKFLKNQMI